MSDLTTVEIETAGEDGSLPGPTERLTRRERSQVSRGGEGEPQDAGLTIEAGGDDDPMAALEASRRALAQRDEELASARRTADQERRAAAEARDQAAPSAPDPVVYHTLTLPTNKEGEPAERPCPYKHTKCTLTTLNIT